MKTVLSLFIFSSSFFSHASDFVISTNLRNNIFETISRDIYFEDEGEVREIKAIELLQFEIIKETQSDLNMRVSSRFYSDWDLKELDLKCNLVVSKLTEKVADFNCRLLNENWPYHD